jgi:DNA-binding transcriptional LysR family regulator
MKLNPAKFDLVSLLLVVRCAEQGSFEEGARATHLSLMAASRRIRLLEAALAKRLFYRRRHGVELTAAGTQVVEHSRTIFLQLDSMSDAVSSTPPADVMDGENLGRARSGRRPSLPPTPGEQASLSHTP